MRRILLLLFVVILVSAKAQRVTLVVPSGHAKNIEQIVISPNGKYAASISNKTVIIWDIPGNKKLHEINLDISLIAAETRSISITDKLDKLAVSTTDGLYCYDIQTKKQIFKAGTITTGAVLTNDGSQIFAVNYGQLEIYDANTGRIIKYIEDVVKNAGEKYKFYQLKENRLLIVYYAGWSIINLANNAIEIKNEFKDVYKEKLSAFDYNPADNTIIGLREEEFIVFDIQTSKPVSSRKSSFSPLGFCFGGNNQVTAFSHDNNSKSYKIEVMKLPQLNVTKTISQPESEVPEAIYYGTAPIAVPGGGEVLFDNNNQLVTVNPNSGAYEKIFENKIVDFKSFYYYTNLSQRLNADNSLRFSTEDNAIRQINFENYKPEGFMSAMKSIVLSADGRLSASIGKKVTILNSETGNTVKTVQLPVNIDPQEEFFFFNKNKIIFTERKAGNLFSIDIASGLISKVTAMGSSFFECSASFDGKYFCALTDKGNIKYLSVFNLETKSMIQNKQVCDTQKDSDCPDGISFLNDSYYIIVTGRKDDIKIYIANDPAYMSSFKLEHYNKLTILGGDIKNNIIAIGEVGNYQVGTHNLKMITKEGKVIREFKSQNNNDFLKATFSKDDKIMFTPTTQKGVQVWNTETGDLLGTYYFIEKTSEYVFISPEGLFDGSPEGMKELYFVKNNEAIALDKLYEKYYTPELLRRKINGEKFAPPDISTLNNAPIVKIVYEDKTGARKNGKPTYTNTNGIAEITVNATAPEDKVDEIRLFHNGKAVNLATRGLFVTDADGTDTKKYTINLLPGNNNFRAIALNSQRTESEPDEINVTYKKDGSAPEPVKPDSKGNVAVDEIDRNATLHIVVVGINAYKNKINPLTYALPDATAFKTELEKDAKSMVNNVKSYLITDDAASKVGIVSAFDNIKKSAKPEDVFVFYYAGHGYIHPSNKEFYLVSSDVADGGESLLKNGVSAKELQTFAVDIPAQKQLFIMDACQSAGAFEKMLQHDGEQQKALAVVSRSTGTHWMAASGSTETAKEFGELGHGVFTYSLLEALKGKAVNNKMITVNGLKNYLQTIVPELVKKYGGNSQYPASYGFGNDFPVEIVK